MADIISITIENFKSYKDESTFTFEAVDSDTCSGNFHVVQLANGEIIRLLNSAVIYGPNAAGKSNIIWAFYVMKKLIEESRMYDPKNDIPFEPFKLSSATMAKPTRMAIEFVLDGYRYTYEISYNAHAFLSENLTKTDRRNRNMNLLNRDKNGKVRLYKHSKEEKVLANHLALSELGLKPIRFIQTVYRNLTGNMIHPLLNIIDLKGANLEIAKNYLSQDNEAMKKALLILIEESDIDICDIGIKSEDDKEIELYHKNEDDKKIKFPIDIESAGTKIMIGVGARILKVLSEGSLLAYDEMNVAIHPKLFRRLVELFHSKETNPRNAQLLITTHDTSLIEENTMRTDQIWFAEKTNGISNIYSAVDFKGVNVSQPIEGWYRAGRLGALPKFKSSSKSTETTKD